jgi:hypothetical protein
MIHSYYFRLIAVGCLFGVGLYQYDPLMAEAMFRITGPIMWGYVLTEILTPFLTEITEAPEP